MKYLITGGCGFIGKRLITRLIAEAAAIRVIDNLAAGTVAGLRTAGPIREEERPSTVRSGEIELIIGDIRDADLAIAATRDIDAVVHLAANTGVGPSVEDPRNDCLTNVLGVFNYLEGSRINSVGRFVFASSSATVGEQEPPITEMAVPSPVSPYAASKLAGEGYCSAYANSFGVAAVTLRFGNVYGPGSAHKQSVVAKFIRRALSGQAFEIYGDGSQTRDFIYIDDLIDAILAALRADGVGGEIFQIASARETTVSEIAVKLGRILEAEGIRGVELRHMSARTGDVKRSFADTRKALRMLDWRATTSLDEGLRTTLRWFIDSSNLPAQGAVTSFVPQPVISAQ